MKRFRERFESLPEWVQTALGLAGIGATVGSMLIFAIAIGAT